MKNVRFIPAIIFLGLSGLMLFGMLQGPGMNNLMPTSNRALPQFDLPVLGSTEDRFSPATLKGQVSLLHVFATWCGICMSEQQRMIKISQDLGIPLYTIVWRSTPESISNWQQGTKAYKNVAMDFTGEAGMELGIMGVPHTFLVDKEARIRYSYIGRIKEEELTGRLIPLIREYQNAK